MGLVLTRAMFIILITLGSIKRWLIASGMKQKSEGIVTDFPNQLECFGAKLPLQSAQAN